jgi:hypothetical protein
MKKVQPIVFMKIFIPVIAIISLVIIGLLSSGCKSTASCEAYGQNNIEYGDISEDEAS